MKSTNALHLSSFQMIVEATGWFLRFCALVSLYFVLFYFSGQIVRPDLPIDIVAEPGSLPLMTALWLTCVATTSAIMLTIHSSRWHGWKLILSLFVFGAIMAWLLYPKYIVMKS